MKKLLASITLVLILSPSLIFAKEDSQAYLCITDKITGFNYNKDNKTWATTEFKTSKETQYTLTRWPNDDSLPINWAFTAKPSWGVWDFEKKGLRLGCIEKEKEIYCSLFDGFSDYFRMDKKTLKFIRSNSGTYISDMEDPAMPMISIGTCSKISL